ncbi:PREDICTED: ankyrin-1-like [Ceratosolen solmsi marchali]|uniref:Ankyrin-1-like n=1 Tax=Ceratosolen solmsi marchali TaxID=326594 RepID=A0AAJ6YVS4_9HYME|nr:PREDICTED: ankyrin-1-like [Ceratosolen solmsi marchali]
MIMVCPATGYEALSFAIRKNSYKMAEKILKQPDALLIDDKWTDYILLIKALQRGCKQITRLLLKNGCRVNKPIKTNFFHTPLYYAVKLKDTQLVELLLSKGALINDKDFNKETPLSLALEKKCYKIVDVLLSKYLNQAIDLTSPSHDDYIAFNAACRRNNKHVVESFLKQEISNNMYLNYESKDEYNDTPLHIAVKYQNLEVIDVLLKYGANANAVNKKEQTPLHLAYYMKEKYPLEKYYKIIDIILSKLKNTNVNPIDNFRLSHFHIACTRNHLDTVKHFLLCKVDINSSTSFDSPTCSGYLPLHFAIENGQKKIIEFLLSQNANTLIKNKEGNTSLHFAFKFFYLDSNLIDLILSKDISKCTNPVNNYGLSHFHIACTTNNIVAIEKFLENEASVFTPVNFNSPICPGYTPLHFAVTFNRSTTAKILLQRNADSNMKEANGFTALHLACQQDAKKIHTILRNSINVSNTYGKINFERAYKESPIKVLDLIAKQTEQVDILDLLLQYKSNVNSQDNSGKTPLFYACDIDDQTFKNEFGNHKTQTLHSVLNQFYIKRNKIIDILLKYKANVNIYDFNSITVLHYIVDINKFFGDDKKTEVVKVLLNKGADVNARTKTGLTPLHIALKKGFIDLVEIFLKYNIDPNIVEYENLYTPLHLATMNDLLAPKSEEIISALLTKGADVDMKQIDGKTPLHIAASTRYTTNRLVTLLKVECDIDCQDKRGKTALHMACLNRNADNVQNLLNHGADINITDTFGKTAFFYFYEFQYDVLDSRVHVYNFHQIYYIFKNHIRRLRVIGFYVSWENMSYYMKLKDLHKQQVVNSDEDDFLMQLENEVQKMKSIKINSYSSLYDILFKDSNEMTLYIKNDKLKNILESSDFKSEFAQYSYLLKLQFEKGLRRSELLKPAKDSLEFILLISLPDACSERIFRYLSNRNLKDLIKSRTLTIKD